VPENYKNILIIKPSSLGDIVLALPALSSLRKSFPDSKISWLIRPEFAPLLENHPDLNEIIYFDRKHLGKLTGLNSLFPLIKKLRNSKFDVIFDFQGLFRTAALTWLSGCKNRFGMSNAREFAPLFYTNKISQDTQSIHLVDFYLKIIKAAGGLQTNPAFNLPVDSAAEKSVQKLLDLHVVKKNNYTVLIPGSAHQDKCWPAERFAEIADKIYFRYNYFVVATGSASEFPIVKSVTKLSKVPIINLAGKTTLKELVALLKGARLVISNDTGPGHIAAALNVPLVMLFGRANPARLAPYKRPQCFIAIDDGSRGVSINNFEPKYDIKNITVDSVFEKILLQIP
jgi:heptosyltransferase-1